MTEVAATASSAVSPSTEGVLVRRPGRPRSAEVDAAILGAATELFVEHGYDGLCVEAVAARAGVSKAAIYRRHPSKAELVMAAAEALSRSAKGPVPDSGSLRDDLRTLAAATGGSSRTARRDGRSPR